MPEVKLPFDKKIWVDLADKTVGNITYKRRALLTGLLLNDEEEFVTIKVRIYPFTRNEDGSYGESLDGVGAFIAQDKVMRADNTTIVDAQAGGALIGTWLQFFGDKTIDPEAAPYEDEAGGTVPGGPLYGKAWMREYDFFQMIAETQPVIVNQLRRQTVLNGDARGQL